MALFERKTPARPGGDEKTTRLTRRQAAAKLCCSETSVLRAERRGELTPYGDARGVTRYNSAEVAKLAAKRSGPRKEGAITALAFRMFEDGSSVAEVVIEAECTTDQARKLYAEWCAMRDVRSGDSVERVRS